MNGGYQCAATIKPGYSLLWRGIAWRVMRVQKRRPIDTIDGVLTMGEPYWIITLANRGCRTIDVRASELTAFETARFEVEL